MCACVEGETGCMDVGVAVKKQAKNRDNYICAD